MSIQVWTLQECSATLLAKCLSEHGPRTRVFSLTMVDPVCAAHISGATISAKVQCGMTLKPSVHMPSIMLSSAVHNTRMGL